MNLLSFKEFVDKYGLKNEATSNVEIKEILGTLKLNSTGIYMRGDQFTTTSGIVNLHLTKGTHWVMFTSEALSPQSNSGASGQIINILIHMDAHLQLIYLITLKKHLFRISNSEKR